MAENAQVRRAAYALVGLALLLAVGFAFMRSETATAPPAPGEAAYREAARLVTRGEGSLTSGDTALAEALRARLTAARDLPFRVHAQRSGAGTCFLIGTPGHRVEVAEREPLLAAAWADAAALAPMGGPVVVGLQGPLTLAGVARGRPGEACEVVAGLAVVPTELFPFFVIEAAPADGAH